jgi:hypothetical protein
MTDTANLGLPLIDGSQAQKHVTHNEALRILDDVIQISVTDATLTGPPSSPADGERHIVATGAGKQRVAFSRSKSRLVCLVNSRRCYAGVRRRGLGACEHRRLVAR